MDGDDNSPQFLVHVSQSALLAWLSQNAFEMESAFAVPLREPGLAHWVARYDHSSVLDMVLNTGSSSLIELVLESSTIPRSLRLLDVAAQHGAVNVVRSLTKSPIGREKIPYLLQLRNQWGETALHILAALPHTASLDILRLLKECCSEGDSWATIEQLEDNWKRSAYTVAVECSNHLVLASGLLSPQSQSLKEAGEVQTFSKFFTTQDYTLAIFICGYIFLSLAAYWRVSFEQGISFKMTGIFLLAWVIVSGILVSFLNSFA